MAVGASVTNFPCPFDVALLPLYLPLGVAPGGCSVLLTGFWSTLKGMLFHFCPGGRAQSCWFLVLLLMCCDECQLCT